MRLLRCACLLVALLAASIASAQSTHIEAAIRASQARAAMRHGDDNEAARLFRESLGLDENAHVLREYAQLLEHLNRLRESAEFWTRYAALASDPAARDEAIAHREQLRRMPSLLRVRVLPGLAARQARVWFDHDPPRYVPVGGAESTVDGGAHRVRVESPGYLAFERMVTTGFGEMVEVVAEMRAAGGDGGT